MSKSSHIAPAKRYAVRQDRTTGKWNLIDTQNADRVIGTHATLSAARDEMAAKNKAY